MLLGQEPVIELSNKRLEMLELDHMWRRYRQILSDVSNDCWEELIQPLLKADKEMKDKAKDRSSVLSQISQEALDKGINSQNIMTTSDFGSSVPKVIVGLVHDAYLRANKSLDINFDAFTSMTRARNTYTHDHFELGDDCTGVGAAEKYRRLARALIVTKKLDDIEKRLVAARAEVPNIKQRHVVRQEIKDKDKTPAPTVALTHRTAIEKIIRNAADVVAAGLEETEIADIDEEAEEDVADAEYVF